MTAWIMDYLMRFLKTVFVCYACYVLFRVRVRAKTLRRTHRTLPRMENIIRGMSIYIKIPIDWLIV